MSWRAVVMPFAYALSSKYRRARLYNTSRWYGFSVRADSNSLSASRVCDARAAVTAAFMIEAYENAPGFASWSAYDARIAVVSPESVARRACPLRAASAYLVPGSFASDSNADLASPAYAVLSAPVAASERSA